MTSALARPPKVEFPNCRPHHLHEAATGRLFGFAVRGRFTGNWTGAQGYPSLPFLGYSIAAGLCLKRPSVLV